MQFFGLKQIFKYVVARQPACLWLAPPAGDPTIAEERAKSIKKYRVFLVFVIKQVKSIEFSCFLLAAVRLVPHTSHDSDSKKYQKASSFLTF